MPSAEPTAAWTPSDWAVAVQELKERSGSALLVHWYHSTGIEAVADVLGDTLQLLRAARQLPHRRLVVAATLHVAESIKLLCPDKQVLIPDRLASCSLAESCPPELFARLREAYPDALALVHIQTEPAVKALSDIVVTTGTAEHIVRQLPADTTLLFAPDHELGSFLRERTGRRIICWFGHCTVHTSFSLEVLQRWRQAYPDALVVGSPQCPAAIRQHADFIGSSRQILDFVAYHRPRRLIASTDHGLAPYMRRALPEDAELLLLPAEHACHCTHCPYMRLNTLPKLYSCLQRGAPEVQLPEEILQRGRSPMERLLELAPPE